MAFRAIFNEKIEEKKSENVCIISGEFFGKTVGPNIAHIPRPAHTVNLGLRNHWTIGH